MENLRVLEGSEVFFRGLQHLYPRFKSGWHLLKSPGNQGFLGFFFFQNPIILSKKRVCVILMPRRPKKGTIED